MVALRAIQFRLPMGSGARKKLIIDTDPGIDDAMAVFLALQSPEVDVIGLTTIFGNVITPMATRNALYLIGLAGREDIPVAEGSHTSIKKVPKLRTATFVHGSDGLGNIDIPPSNCKPLAQSASDFLVEKANEFPHEVTIVALGPLTNIALAIQSNPLFAKKISQIVVLGGAFAMNGNVNPAAEANIFGDPEAADIVFTSGADIIVVGLNITHQIVLTDKDYEVLAQSNGMYANNLCRMLKCYFDYHLEAYNLAGVYLHDPTTMFAAIDPSLLTYEVGVVRVQTEGIFRGLTIFYNMNKRFVLDNEWSNKPPIKVAVSVDSDQIIRLLMERLQKV